MPLQSIGSLLFDAVDLLRMALVVAVPGFVLTLVGQWLFKKMRKRFGLNWVQAAFVSTFIITLAIVFLLYLFPYYLAVIETKPIADLPIAEVQVTFVDHGIAFFSTIVKNLLTGLVFTILLLPLIFFGSFVSEKIDEKKKLHPLANTFAAVYCTALLIWIIILFVFPWALSGLVYLLYWSQI